MELATLFEMKLNSIEQQNCLACNYTMQSQKGHKIFCDKDIFSEEDKEVELILKNSKNIVSGLCVSVRNLC